jgi:hypothetical protein
MGDLTEAEVCERANVEPAFVKELVENEVLEPEEGEKPYRGGDVWRARLAKACVDAGLPLDGIGEAIRRKLLTLSMLDLPQYGHWSGFADETLRAARSADGVAIGVRLPGARGCGVPARLPLGQSPARRARFDPGDADRACVRLRHGLDPARLPRVWGEPPSHRAGGVAAVSREDRRSPPAAEALPRGGVRAGRRVRRAGHGGARPGIAGRLPPSSRGGMGWAISWSTSRPRSTREACTRSSPGRRR